MLLLFVFVRELPSCLTKEYHVLKKNVYIAAVTHLEEGNVFYSNENMNCIQICLFDA